MSEQLLSVRQACERLSLSKAYLYELMRRGDGPVSLKIGAKRMFREAALDAWVRQQQAQSLAAEAAGAAPAEQAA